MGRQFYPKYGIKLDEVTERIVIEEYGFVRDKDSSLSTDETWLKNNRDSTESVVKYFRKLNQEFVNIYYDNDGSVNQWESGDHGEITRTFYGDYQPQLFAQLLTFLAR